MSERDFLGDRVTNGVTVGPQVAKNAIGLAAERLVARALGARTWDHDLPPFPVPSSVAVESDGSPLTLAPDAWWGRQSALIEVKAGIARFYVTERQWKAYVWARDTQRSGLPVARPRVFYAFVAYRLPKVTSRYPGLHEVLDDALSGIRYIVVVDSTLVARLISGGCAYRGDCAGPLSLTLGVWNAHYSVRAHQLQRWADDPRGSLDDLGNAFGSWRPRSFRASLQAAAAELADAGWAQVPDVPAVVLAPRRKRRVSPTLLPGGQARLLGLGPVACPECGCWGPPGDCRECGAFTAF